jgi:glutamate synthase domain-containing protein 1
MCGIIGFLDKRGGQNRPVGRTLLTMLQALSCRGPDSAGVAIFGPPHARWILQVKIPEHGDPARASKTALETLRDCVSVIGHKTTGAYLRLEVERSADPAELEQTLLACLSPLTLPSPPWGGEGGVRGGAEIVSLGQQLEIVKQVGSPAQLEQTYGIARKVGSHGIGHTRLSTESRVDLSHSQPFWAHGVPDLATVHNGHITNYHKLRRQYEQRGYRFFTENDSEVIGVYLRDRQATGLSLVDALRSSLDDFDGSFSYLAASADQMAYVKDGFGFKPLMVAETDDFVAIATEEIALRQALGRDFVAREPAPGTMHVWSVKEEVKGATAPSS